MFLRLLPHLAFFSIVGESLEIIKFEFSSNDKKLRNTLLFNRNTLNREVSVMINVAFYFKKFTCYVLDRELTP